MLNEERQSLLKALSDQIDQNESGDKVWFLYKKFSMGWWYFLEAVSTVLLALGVFAHMVFLVAGLVLYIPVYFIKRRRNQVMTKSPNHHAFILTPEGLINRHFGKADFILWGEVKNLTTDYLTYVRDSVKEEKLFFNDIKPLDSYNDTGQALAAYTAQHTGYPLQVISPFPIG